MNDPRFRLDRQGRVIFFPSLPLFHSPDSAKGFFLPDEASYRLAVEAVSTSTAFQLINWVTPAAVIFWILMTDMGETNPPLFQRFPAIAIALKILGIGGVVVMLTHKSRRAHLKIQKLPRFPGTYADTIPFQDTREAA